MNIECVLCAHSQQLTVAKKAVEKHVLHWHQLYEQQKQKKATSEEMTFDLDCFVTRWRRWAAVGLQCIAIEHYNDLQRRAVIKTSAQHRLGT
jgi:hypothetical protein